MLRVIKDFSNGSKFVFYSSNYVPITLKIWVLSAIWYSARCRESRPASATGRPQPENLSAATASWGSILLGDSFPTLEELEAAFDHCQTGNRHQMAHAGVQALLAM